MKNIFNEGTLSLALIILALLFLDPFMLWMPTPAVYALMAGVIIAFVAFAAFVWKERALDERDEYHKMIAARAGFIVGVGTLLLGTIWQTLEHSLDPWLVYSLVIMVVAKFAALSYSKRKL